MLKIDKIVVLWVYSTSLLTSSCCGNFRNRLTIFHKTLCGLGSLMNEGLMTEMRIRFLILIIQCDFKMVYPA